MLRILCVDDDRLVLAITADLLRDLGHEVIEVSAVSDASRIVAADNIGLDLLITDIHLPGAIDGIGLAERARRTHPRLPVIYFSGLAHVVPPGIKSTVLHKPCTLGELERAIDLTRRCPVGTPMSPAASTG
ncbi:MAG: response regulator [Rhizorhabdus sp.]|nr:response regulator [Rhizorhabdus sp.]TAK09025.1 MAG: response regulator [Rhizorhabdus sp.]